MANATIKITQLPNIGSNLAANTLLPVVDTTGTAVTEKVTVGNVANFILTEAGNLLPEAFVAQLAYSVTNAAQPNITSTGTLTNLSVSGNANVGNLNVSTKTNLGAIGNVTITGGTNGYVLQTDGTGNLTWTAQTGGGGNGEPGGANTQVQYNDAGSFGGESTFTYNKTTNMLTVGNITVTSNVSVDYITATHDLTANVVTANFLYGDASNVTNIPNLFNQDLNTTDNVQFANITSTEAIKFNNAGNIVGALGYAPTFVSIESYGSNTVQITANDFHTWSFGNTGVLSKSDANGLVLAASYSAQIITDYGDNDRTWLFDGTSGELVLPGGNVLIDPTDDNFEVRGAQAVNFEANTIVNIYTDTSNAAYQWQFGDDGQFNLPANSASFSLGRIQSANGYPTLLSYGSGEHGGPELVWMDGNDPQDMSNANVVRNTMYLNDQGLYIGMNENGNSVPSFTGNWQFGSDGNLTLPGNTFSVNYANGAQVNISGGGANLGNLEVTGTTISIANGASQSSILVGNGPAGLTLGLDSVGPAYLNLYANTYDTQTYSTGSGYTTGTYTASVGGGTITLTDATVIETYLNSISKPATITSLVINGTDTVPYDGASYGGGTVNLSTTTAPGVDPTTVTSILFNVTYQNQFLIDEDNGDYGIYLGDLNFDIESKADVNITAGDDLRLESNDVLSLTNNGDISFTTNANSSSFSWAFHNTGVTYFPTLTVDLHNGGNQSGQVLQFGDTTQQVIITGPTPGVDTNAQRLIIQGQRASGVGEGGDVYFWAGDADLYGGDIKIYAGDADNVSAGYGGYVNIEGGSGFDEGGYVRMTGGQSSNGAGAPASVIGGYGNTAGGDANLQGGQGTVAGGNVNITGGYGGGGPGGNVTIVAGGSANGLTDYGNINMTAGASSWVFGRDGNLTLPSNSFTVNYANGDQVSLGSAALGNLTVDDITLQGASYDLYLSPGPDFTANLAYFRVRGGDVASHMHFDTGNNEAYDLIIGDDNKFTQVSSTGNIIMRSYDSANGLGYTATLDTTGNLTIPGDIISNGDIGIYNIVGNASGTNEAGAPGGPGSQTFNAQVTYFPTVGDIQVGWTVTGNNLIGTTTVTVVDEYSPGFFEITTDTGVTNAFWYGDTYTFTGPQSNIGYIFNNDGILTLPGEGIIRSNDDTIILQSYDVANTTAYEVRVGTTGGLYLQQGANTAWLSLFPNSGDAEITAGLGTSGGAGKNLSITAGSADQSDYYTTAGGNVNITGGLGATNDGGGGGQGGSVNITSGDSADPAGVAGNVSVGAGDYTWTFDYTGNLTLPSNTFSVNYSNGAQVPLGGVAEASFSIQTNNFNATAGSRYGVNTSGGAVTATLPASPATGDAIFFADAGGAYSSNNLTIARNGQTIMGSASDLTVSTNNQSVGLFYNGTTWRTYNAG